MLYGYESEEVGLEAGDVARGIILELIAPRDADALDIAEAIEDFDALRQPPLARAVGAGAGAGGGGARHPLGAAERRQPDPGRPGQVPEAHRGGADQPDLAHRRRDRLGQGALHAAARPTSGCRCRSSGTCATPRTRSRRPNHIGFPVVVKPVDGNHGRGVSVNLTTDAEVADAFEIADQRGQRRRGREHDPGRRPPAAGDRRRAGRRGAPDARPRGRRRRAHASPSWSRS